MRHRSVLCVSGLLAVLASTASPAFAQFIPRRVNDPATGEIYQLEFSAGFWSPAAEMSISSESLGIPGTRIDFKNDLGLTDQRFSEIHAVLHPARKHKLRFQYIPINYVQSSTLQQDVVFNGQKYKAGVLVNSELHWKAYRFTYEYDFIATDRVFGGFMVDLKQTDARVRLQGPLTDEFTHAKAPIPALGGILRGYVARNISITGELTGFKIPDRVSKDYKGHYVDLDIYGTVNFSKALGAQFGYRMFDIGYVAKVDSGSFRLKGPYFGAVVRY